jgi:hypothetical protein
MSIFDPFKQQSPSGGTPMEGEQVPLSIEDLGAMDPAMSEDPMSAFGPSMGDPALEEPSPEGPGYAMTGQDKDEMTDMLLERAKARELRSLEYQQAAFQAGK